MLGSLFNRKQQAINAQNVKTFLRCFGAGTTAVGYSEFQGTGKPSAEYGREGDVYVDLTEDAMALYGHDGDGWVMWSGPSTSSSFAHPKDRNRLLWCNGQTFGWIPRSRNSCYGDKTQAEALAMAIAKKSEGPRKRKSYDAAASEHGNAKKLKPEARREPPAAESQRSQSASVGAEVMSEARLIVPSQAPLCLREGGSPTPWMPIVPSNIGPRDVETKTSSSNQNTLQPNERSTLLLENQRLREVASRAQDQLAMVNQRMFQLEEDNEMLRRTLSAALSRTCMGPGCSVHTSQPTNMDMNSEPANNLISHMHPHSSHQSITSPTSPVITIPIGFNLDAPRFGSRGHGHDVTHERHLEMSSNRESTIEQDMCDIPAEGDINDELDMADTEDDIGRRIQGNTEDRAQQEVNMKSVYEVNLNVAKSTHQLNMSRGAGEDTGQMHDSGDADDMIDFDDDSDDAEEDQLLSSELDVHPADNNDADIAEDERPQHAADLDTAATECASAELTSDQGQPGLEALNKIETPPASALNVDDSPLAMATLSSSSRSESPAAEVPETPKEGQFNDKLVRGISEARDDSSLASESTPATFITDLQTQFLYATTSKCYLCRFCVASVPRIIVKFPLSSSLRALEAHSKEIHEAEYRVLLDMSPTEIKNLLSIDPSAS